MAESEHQLYSEFENLVRELRLNNRHFVKSKMSDRLQEFVLDENQYSLVTRDMRLFRARICNEEDSAVELNLHHRGVKFGTFDLNRSLCYSEKEPKDKMLAGYDEKGSGAPPAKLCGENRANGKGIRRLYVAENARTAIMETKPSLGNLVSIAELKIINPPFLVLDLTMERSDNAEIDYLRFLLDRQFSLACAGDVVSYSFTQWFSDLVAKEGRKITSTIGNDNIVFQPYGRGIKYSSAMHLLGKNMVIFGMHGDNGVTHPNSTEFSSEHLFNVVVIRSEIYLIRDVEYHFQQFKLERDDVFKLEQNTCNLSMDMLEA